MAIQSIYRDMEYAKSLIKRKAGKNGQVDADEDEESAEESWTFIGNDEPDPDMMTKKLSDMGALQGSDSETAGLRLPGTTDSKPLGTRVLRPPSSQPSA